jgi:spore germination protein KA
MHPDQKTNKNESNAKQDTTLKISLMSNITAIKEFLGNSSDLIIQQLSFDDNQIAFLYITGLVNDKQTKDIIKTAKMEYVQLKQSSLYKNFFEIIKDTVSIGDTKEQTDLEHIAHSLLSGSLIVLVDEWTTALIVDVSGGEVRAVSTPQSQTVVRGPKDSFTESIQTNQALIRRRLKSPNLRVKSMEIGNISNTTVSVMYVEGIVNPQLLDEVVKKLEKIEIDGVLESGYLESFIEDNAFSPFPTVLSAERPDLVAGNLLEGKVAILTDQTPFALVVPATFFAFFQSIEDYAQRFDISALIRMLRYVIFFVSMVTPALYIALMTYHPEMLPTPIAISLSAQREGVPFPTVIEALIMEIVIETLREAGIRSPSPLSVMISIVGAIVIGSVAIEASIVSPVMVMVVATTAIASFATPSYSLAISARIIRFGLMLLAASFGLFGITLSLIFLTVHMNTLRSFGTPYLAPFAPFLLQDQKDSIFRFPLWTLSLRPKSIVAKTDLRIPKGQKPEPSINNKDEGTAEHE